MKGHGGVTWTQLSDLKVGRPVGVKHTWDSSELVGARVTGRGAGRGIRRSCSSLHNSQGLLCGGAVGVKSAGTQLPWRKLADILSI